MKITLLPGDGIGVEIVDAAVEVLDAAAKKYNFTVEYDKKLIGARLLTLSARRCRKKHWQAPKQATQCFWVR